MNEELTARNQALSVLAEKLQEEVSGLSEKLKRETERVEKTWRMSCVQVARLDELLAAKEVEINSGAGNQQQAWDTGCTLVCTSLSPHSGDPSDCHTA